MTEPGTPQLLSVEQRHTILEQAVGAYASGGWQPTFIGDTTATVVAGRPVNHTLHLLLTLVTCGLWAFVWILVSVSGGQKQTTISVDEWGTPVYQMR